MPRFFVDKQNITSNEIRICGEDVAHIKKVLRLGPGSIIIVSDGCCNDYSSVIKNIESDSILLDIIESSTNKNEPSIDVTLFQGIPKSDKMDLIIQKSVELGVNSIVPVINERTVVKIDNIKDSAKKTQRWQKISLEAAKQCNRGIIPVVSSPVDFTDALKMAKNYDLSLMPYEKEDKGGLRQYISGFKGNKKKIAIFIGPEGGFAENEVLQALSTETKTVSLGPRILRTETAGIAVLAILMYELGDVF